MKQSFIKKLDAHLLKNSPVTWSTRIHLAAVYGTLFTAALILICFIVPDDPRNPSEIYSWVVLLGVVSLLAFVVWMIFLLRFNVFKRFGKWNSFDTLKTFVLYFLIILIIVSWPIIPPIIQSIRANNKYSAEEMINDVNAMNIKLCQLEKDSIDKRFSVDTVQLSNSVDGMIQKTNYNDTVPENLKNNNYYFADSSALKERLLESDSLKKMNDSVYIFYDCPGYDFVEYDYYNAVGKNKLLKSIDLFRNILQNKTQFDKAILRKELGQLFIKYSKNHNPTTLLVDGYDYGQNATSVVYRIRSRYDISYINNAIKNILEKKYRWDRSAIAFTWRFIYYTTLILSLLVLIYRHTTRKTFFLSILTSIVISIITGLILATSYSPNGGNFYSAVIIYFIVFAIVAAMIFKNDNRSIVSGIAFNLLVSITPFLPLVCSGLYYSILRDRYSRVKLSPIIYDELFVNEWFHYFISEIIGFGLLLFLLATIYRAAYRRWFALPDQ